MLVPNNQNLCLIFGLVNFGRITTLVPPGVCGSRPLLAVWDPKFHTAHFMSARPTRVKTLRQPIAFLMQQEKTLNTPRHRRL